MENYNALAALSNYQKAVRTWISACILFHDCSAEWTHKSENKQSNYRAGALAIHKNCFLFYQSLVITRRQLAAS